MAFERVFGAPTVRLYCFFHVLHNLEKYLKLLTKGGICGQLKMDLNTLQISPNEIMFQKVSQLFMMKWREKKDDRIKKLLDHFFSQYLETHNTWCEVGFPSSNNGLEGTNGWIKRSLTIRERAPVGRFAVEVFELLRGWSEVRDPSSTNCIHFARSRTLQLKD